MSGSNERAAAPEGVRTYRAGIAAAVTASFLIVWTTIVRDDASGAGNLMIVLAAAVSAFAAGFSAAGMARAMLGVAAMTVVMGLLMATDPSTPYIERALLWTGIITGLWLVSAALFRAAGQAGAFTSPRP